MKNYGMIVDEQEIGIVNYCVRVARYNFDPWGLNWTWGHEESPDFYTWA